jgi:DHA1 family tetracycline resistance protein-like MFS transporter
MLCVGGMGMSILTAVISKQVDENRQGQLQGVMSSVQSLAAIIGPVLMLNVYFLTREQVPGLAWLVGAGLYLLCLPVLLRRSIYQ